MVHTRTDQRLLRMKSARVHCGTQSAGAQRKNTVSKEARTGATMPYVAVQRGAFQIIKDACSAV
jgi:hypothetical protein